MVGFSNRREMNEKDAASATASKSARLSVLNSPLGNSQTACRDRGQASAHHAAGVGARLEMLRKEVAAGRSEF